MTAYASRLRPLSIGVALDERRLVAALPSRGGIRKEIWTRPLVAATDDTGPWPHLDDCLRELKSLIDTRRARLHVALMPTLAQLRLLDLPGVEEAEAEKVVRRDTSRFFAGCEESRAVELCGSGWRRRSPFVAAAAARSVVDAIGNSAQRAGFALLGIAPAPLAWAASLPRHSTPQDIVVALDAQLLLLRVRNRRIIAVRRLPKRDPDSSREALRAQLAGQGVVLAADATFLSSVEESLACAASSVVRVSLPVLLPDELRGRPWLRARWGALSRLAAATLLLTASGASELVGLQRERNAIAAERSRIKARAAQSLVVRDSIALLRQRIVLVRDMASRSDQWSGLMSSIADALPPDAFLKSLIVEGDSLRLEGSSDRAAPVFDALVSAAGVRAVHPTAPIRQEIRAGRVDEQFALAALLAHSPNAFIRVAPNGSERSAIGRQP